MVRKVRGYHMFEVKKSIVFCSAMDRTIKVDTKSDDCSVVLAIDDFGFYVATKYEKSLNELTDDEIKVATATFIDSLRNEIKNIVEFSRKCN